MLRHLIDMNDLSQGEIDSLIKTAEDIAANPAKYCERCKGKKLGSLFFEPSTRTRLSFEAAMLDLGGACIGFSDSGSSSASKGESVSDTVHTVSLYADIIAMRHPKEGAPKYAARSSRVPVINAGDGGHNHPTQTLTDLMTIAAEKGRIGNLKIGVCGDLKFGRTVHSLISALSRYEGIELVLISPQELRLPEYVLKTWIIDKGVKYRETRLMEPELADLDVLYMTRVQRERFFNEADYIRLKDNFILDVEKMKKASPSISIMHPLPRVNEISVKVDADPRACYFRQVENGKFIRMALILKLLEEAAHDN